jgi:hypothetical protein
VAAAPCFWSFWGPTFEGFLVVSRFIVWVGLGWGAMLLPARVFWQCLGMMLPVLGMLCVCRRGRGGCLIYFLRVFFEVLWDAVEFGRLC